MEDDGLMSNGSQEDLDENQQQGGSGEDDEDYEYEYEDDVNGPSGSGDCRESGYGISYGFLDGSEADLFGCWGQGNTIRLAVASCLRQIAVHSSHSLSVVFSREELFDDPESTQEVSPIKDFLILVRISSRVVVSYMLKFNCAVEMIKSPPRLTCLTQCGRGTFLYPDLLLPNHFGPCLDYGNMFNRLREELQIVFSEGCIEPVAVAEMSASWCIQELAYSTQYITMSVIHIGGDENGIRTGKLRDSVASSTDSGLGYSVVTSSSTIVKDETNVNRLTDLFQRISAGLDDTTANSPILELIFMSLKEFSPEEAMHSPEYATAIFGLVGDMQTRRDECISPGEALITGKKRNFEDYDSTDSIPLPSDQKYSKDYLLLLIYEYKCVLGDDYGLSRIRIPTRIKNEAKSRNKQGSLYGKAGLREFSIEKIVGGSVTVLGDGFRRFDESLKPNTAPPLSLIKRWRAELNTLKNNLGPCIHVLTNEVDFTCFKFLIIGPEGTPYENGFFIFNLSLPSDYPSSPPKVRKYYHYNCLHSSQLTLFLI